MPRIRKPNARARSRRKTIKFSELRALSVCNSPEIPKAVNVGGTRREWVGIGWIDVGKLKGDEVEVIDG